MIQLRDNVPAAFIYALWDAGYTKQILMNDVIYFETGVEISIY